MSTTPAVDRAFCTVASSSSGDKNHNTTTANTDMTTTTTTTMMSRRACILLPWVSIRGRRAGLLTAATTGNWEVLQQVLGSMLEAEIASVSNEKDNVRARLRQEEKFSTFARAMEGAASRGHYQCCELLWVCCDEISKKRSISAAELNGHNELVETLRGWKCVEEKELMGGGGGAGGGGEAGW